MSTEDHLPVLSRLAGDYELLGAIGEGALAQVFKARRRSTGALVAIKVMREEFWADVEARERLRREALAICAIESPHVCAIYDFDTDEKAAFIVMEYVEGTTLRAVLKKHTWTATDISVVVGQIGLALHAAHRHGIVHRDLKPENIMLTGTGEARAVKVLDFGFAKLLELERADELSQLTQLGACFGTPQYMSPEQIGGHELDTGSDLFSLGVIAYELVGLKRPWNGSTAQDVMVAVASAPIPPLDRVHADLAGRRAALDAFFESALSRDPHARPRDAPDFCARFNLALGVARARDDGEFEDAHDLFGGVTSAILSIEVLATLVGSPLVSPSEVERLLSQWHPRGPAVEAATLVASSVEAATRTAPSSPSPPAAPSASRRTNPQRAGRTSDAAGAAAAEPVPRSSGSFPVQPGGRSVPRHSTEIVATGREDASMRRRLLLWTALAFVVGVALTSTLFVVLSR